jgi:hypothetical protein
MQKWSRNLKYVYFLIIVLGLAYLLVLYFLPKYSVTGQLLRQEQALAKAEAHNIQSFIEGLGNGLVATSQKKDIIYSGNGTVAVLKSFADQLGKNNIIAGISLTDKNGLITYNYSNLAPPEIGNSVADRDYFIWAKSQINSDNYLVGETVIARFGVNKGQYVTPVAVPVFENGVFSGVLVSAIRLSELAKHYLSIMSISETADAYIVGLSGHVLFSNNDPGKIGMNIGESKQKNLFSDNTNLNEKIYHALSKEKEGSVIARYIDPISNKPEIHALAYAPIILSGRHWLIVLATPATEVTKASMPTYVNQIAVLLLLALTTFSLGIFLRRRKSE